MKLQRMKLMTGAIATLALSAGFAAAQGISGDTVKIGAVVDMTGVYSGNGGMGAVLGAEMAIEDFGGTVNGKPIELLSANYQNRVDVASNLAREWIDRDGVDMIIESMDSAAAIATQNIGKEKNVLTIAAGSASTALTNAECSATGIHYVYDTFALATGTGNAIVKNGLTDWYFITADYAFGHAGLCPDDVFLCLAVTHHRWRGRFAKHPAQLSVRAHRHVFGQGVLLDGRGDLHGRHPVYLPGDPFPVRRGAKRHPRERTADDLARVSGAALQVGDLHHLGGPVRACGRDQGAGVSSGLAG